MATTRAEIREWVEEALADGATHLIVVCDTFDWQDYPIAVRGDEDVRKVFLEHDGPDMQKVMEVYDLRKPIDPQLTSKDRVFNF